MHKVLIVDDEPWSREVVKSLGDWESLRMKVIGEAEDGNEGLRLMQELGPDVLITDMRMPGIDGTELLKAVNERFPSLKIIIMSGYDDFIYMKQAIRSHAAEYLLKPIDPDELNTALRQCAAELEEDAQKANNPLSIPPSFPDPADMDRYIAFRRLVNGHLLELNRSALYEAFEKLKKFLETIFHKDNNENMLVRIGHDFLLLLEEFLSGNEVASGSVWDDRNNVWTFKAGSDSISGLFADICRLYGKAMDAVEESRKSRNSIDLKEVQKYIDRHYQEQISLETIAQYFFVSKEHLSRVYKNFSGMNISDCIVGKRMDKARELITEHGLAIKHAAHMVGYTDLAYFYRVFKKHFGLTPGDLRKDD